MIGVDLGLNVGSVIRLKKSKFPRDKGWLVKDQLVLKFTREKEIEDEDMRIEAVARRFAEVITKMAAEGERVYIETPIYSWGRKNPKGFAKNVSLFTLVKYHLVYAGRKLNVISVNNKSAKKAAGSGSKDKEAMILAYRSHQGVYPGHSTQYGKETLADSYFIALAGYSASKKGLA